MKVKMFGGGLAANKEVEAIIEKCDLFEGKVGWDLEAGLSEDLT